MREKTEPLIVVLLLLIFPLLSSVFILYGFQKQQKPLPQEKHEVEVRLVLVDVIVTKGGDFVTDLTRGDFELFEDGKEVPINSVELISYAERKIVTLKEETEEEVPLNVPYKKLVVVVDGVNSWSRNLRRGSKKIIDELISLVKLGHEVMVIHMSGKEGIDIIQPFTIDEALIGKAIEEATGSIWVDKSLDALKMTQDVGTEGAGEQAKADRSTGIADQEAALIDDYLFTAKQRFEYSIGKILAVFNMIKDLPGRKSVLLISDGFPDLTSVAIDSIITKLTPTGTTSKARSTQLDLKKDVGVIRIFDPFNIFDNKKFTGSDQVIRELIRFANSQNISIYTLDPGTFSEYFYTASAESSPLASMLSKTEKIKQIQNLRWISEGTGAAWLRGAKKYEKFRHVMKTDLNYYYQLSYYPRKNEPDNQYHKIKVKVKRPGMDVRFREGYKDYSEEEQEKMLLVTAFYNPSLFKALPFHAELVPLYKDSNRYEPWMNVALPGKKLFLQKELEYGLKKLDLHIWIKEKKRGEKTFGGQVSILFNIDTSFIDSLKTIDYLRYHYKGPALTFKEREYQTVFAIFDPQTNDVGTWESSIYIPDFKEEKEGCVLNCVLGFLYRNPKKGKLSFSISQDDGSLEYGEIKFFPAVTSQFHRMQDASVFLQVFSPLGKIASSPRFEISGEGRLTQQIPGKLVAESWNKESKIWSGLFNLNLANVIFGDYTLKAEIPVSDEGRVSKEIKLIKLRY